MKLLCQFGLDPTNGSQDIQEKPPHGLLLKTDPFSTFFAIWHWPLTLQTKKCHRHLPDWYTQLFSAACSYLRSSVLGVMPVRNVFFGVLEMLVKTVCRLHPSYAYVCCPLASISLWPLIIFYVALHIISHLLCRARGEGVTNSLLHVLYMSIS